MAVACGAAGCQPCVGDAVCLALGGGVAEYGGQEGFSVEFVDGRGGVRGDGGGARDVAEQGDLADSLAASAAAQELPVVLDVEFPGGDGVVGVAAVALADQGGAGGQVAWGEGGGEAFDGGCGQFGEQWERAQQRDLDHGNGCVGVEAEQGAPAGRGRQRQHGCDAQQCEPAAAQVDQGRHEQRAECVP